MTQTIEFKAHPADTIRYTVRPWGTYGWQVFKHRGKVDVKGMLVETYRGEEAGKAAAIEHARRLVGQ